MAYVDNQHRAEKSSTTRLQQHADVAVKRLNAEEMVLFLEHCQAHSGVELNKYRGFSELGFSNMQIASVLEYKDTNYTDNLKEALSLLSYGRSEASRSWLYKNASEDIVHCLLDRAECNKWGDPCFVEVTANPSYSVNHFDKIIESRHLLDHIIIVTKIAHQTPPIFFKLETLRKVSLHLRGNFKINDEVKSAVYLNEFPEFIEMPKNWTAHMFNISWGEEFKKHF